MPDMTVLRQLVDSSSNARANAETEIFEEEPHVSINNAVLRKVFMTFLF